jgi:hypothetical protein
MPVDPTFSDLTPSSVTPPNVSQWYYTDAVPLVPDTVAPFLAAHGFLVVNGTEHYIDGDFAGYLLNMKRETFSHGDAIQLLLEAMTFAYNEGRTINDTRYEDIIRGRKEVLANHQAEVAETEQVFEGQYTLLLADINAITADAPTLVEWTAALATLNAKLDEYDTDVAALIAAYQLDETALTTAVSGAFAALTTALTAYRAEVTNLKAGQGTIEASIQAILSTETSQLAGHETDIAAALDALDDQYATQLAAAEAALAAMESAIGTFATDSAAIIAAMEAELPPHVAAIGALLAEVVAAFGASETTLVNLLSTLVSDYDSHASTATAFLDNLGTTELARINEKYDNLLAAVNQRLLDRGFYSSALITQMEAQVERERNEEIGILNDRLNREKWENQHRLYEQQQAMRGAHIGVHQQLHAAHQQTIQFRVETTDRLNARSLEVKRLSLQSRQETERIRQELFRLQVAVAESFQRMFVEIKSTIVQGLGQLQSARLAVSRGQAEDYHKIFGQIAETFARSLAGEDRFAALDVSLREREQGTLATIEQLGQSWSQTQAGMLESGIARRSESANLESNVRRAYYETLIRMRVESMQGRLAAATAKATLLDSHINQTTGVAAALFDFAERREDTHPSLGDMAALVASLGDDQ